MINEWFINMSKISVLCIYITTATMVTPCYVSLTFNMFNIMLCYFMVTDNIITLY